ncbi:MAG: thermonuclease family protein [Candidatus Marinimicrobia bacterium]|jgi:endonuclease YncB( thermonuclease family)|nr:thermonuclease family protein [Candidatus Neomarinimicrobiota bacterium]
MNHDWRRKKPKLRLPSDGVLGIGVLSAVALVVLIVIINKSEDKSVSSESIPSVQRYTKAVRVIDGDTIEVESDKFRLFGIDAPEQGQPCKRNNVPYDCGGASKTHLEFILTGASVECEKNGKDRWGRYIGKCTADGEDISKLMTRHGWAVAYRKYSTDYVQDEEFAQSNNLGMWAKEFSVPSEWRKSDKGDKL